MGSGGCATLYRVADTYIHLIMFPSEHPETRGRPPAVGMTTPSSGVMKPLRMRCDGLLLEEQQHRQAVCQTSLTPTDLQLARRCIMYVLEHYEQAMTKLSSQAFTSLVEQMLPRLKRTVTEQLKQSEMDTM